MISSVMAGCFDMLTAPFALYSQNCIFADVVNIDQNDDDHDSDEKLLHRLFIDPGIDFASDDTAENTTDHHSDEKRKLKIRNFSLQDGFQRARRLGKQNDVQGIFRGRFRVHGKEDEQDDQIDRAPSDAEKRRKDSQNQADQKYGDRMLYDTGMKPILSDGADQRPDGNQHQAGRLNRAHHVLIGKKKADPVEQFLSGKAAYSSANGQDGAGTHFDQRVSAQSGFDHGVAGHGQHRASGKKTDGRNAEQAKRIEYGLNDDAAPDTADSADHACSKADQQKDYIHKIPLISMLCRSFYLTTSEQEGQAGNPYGIR